MPSSRLGIDKYQIGLIRLGFELASFRIGSLCSTNLATVYLHGFGRICACIRMYYWTPTLQEQGLNEKFSLWYLCKGLPFIENLNLISEWWAAAWHWSVCAAVLPDWKQTGAGYVLLLHHNVGWIRALEDSRRKHKAQSPCHNLPDWWNGWKPNKIWWNALISVSYILSIWRIHSVHVDVRQSW